MQAHIDHQGKRIDDFTEGMKKLSAAAAAAAAKDGTIQQLRDEIREKDLCIQKLRLKFSQATAGGVAAKAGWLTPRTSGAITGTRDKALAENHSLSLDSSLGRGKVALEQLEFLSKVFEQEIGVMVSSTSHRPRPSPIIAPDRLQAMLAVENQAPPPNSSSYSDAAPSSRPLFLARRLRLSTPPQPAGAPASQSQELPPALVSSCEIELFRVVCHTSLQQPVLSTKSIAPQARHSALLLP
jgi:hypothetical protein